MTLGTAKKFTKDLLPLIIHLDTRLTDQERKHIDCMTRHELLDFVMKEDPHRMFVFVQESSHLTDEALKDKIKNRLRLNVEEIAALGDVKNMAAYWYKVRPKSWRPVGK